MVKTAGRAGPGFSRRGRAGVLLVVGALAATLIVPAFIGGEDALRATLHLPASGYCALFATILASWVARALKLGTLLRRMGVDLEFMHVFEISLATDFGFLATPAGLGGYAASVYYVRRAGASLDVAAALTAADQVLDLMFFALALPVAGILFFGAGLPAPLVAAALGVATLLATLAFVALLAYRSRRTSHSAFAALIARWPRVQRAIHAASRFLTHLRGQIGTLASGGPVFLGGVFGLTIVQWMTRYGVLWLVLQLLGHPVPFWLLLVLQGLVLHVAQWSGIPAGGGGAELGLSAALTTWLPATTLGTALLLWRMVTLYLALLAGAIAIVRLARRGRIAVLPAASH